MKKKLEFLIVLALLAILVFVGKDKLAVFYYNRGDYYLNRNLYKEALDCFNNSLRINPSFAIVHYGLANTYMEIQDEDRALGEYNKVIKLDSGFIPAYKALAHIYLKRKFYQEAIDLLEKAEEIAPDNPEIKGLINSAYFEGMASLINAGVGSFLAGDKPKAYSLLNKALQINPNYVFTLYTLGFFYYSEHKYDEAEAILKEVLLLDSGHLFSRKLLGDVYFNKGIFEKAIEEYKLTLPAKRDDAILLNNIGLAYMNLENYGEAILFLKEAFSLSPENVNIRYSLASLYRDTGRLKEAAVEYAGVINMQPDYPGVHNDLGDIYKLQGRLGEALEEFYREIASCQNKLVKDPDNPLLLNNISYAYNGAGEYDKAKVSINKALAIKPDYMQAYLTLADIYKNLGNFEESLTALKKAKGFSSRKYAFIESSIADLKRMGSFARGKIIFNPVDTVYLRNGRQLKGIIKEQSREGVTLEIDAGGTIGAVMLPRNTIERIISEKNNKPD